MLAIVRPGSRGVICRIVWLADRDDQMPLQRRLLDARDQGIEQVIPGLAPSCGQWRIGCGWRTS
jgi:hypothetical protein